ncbi:MAG: hypothetical protein MdMp024_1637 [Bacteroidales bacterium]
MKIKPFPWIYLSMICLASCISGELDNETPSTGRYTSLQIPLLRGSAADEDRIDNARIVVCRTTGAHDVLVNEYRTAPNIAFDVIVPVGYVDLYLIANEQPYWDLNQTASSGQLKQVMQRYAAYPKVDAQHSIPMFGKYENLYIDSDGSTSINGLPVNLHPAAQGTVERIFSKVTLNLQCEFAKLKNNGDPIEVKSVSVKSLPAGSYLSPARYLGTPPAGFFDGANAPASDYVYTNTGFSGSSSFYIPEYIVNDPDLYSYLSVTVNLKDDPAADREYKVVIGDGVKAPGHDNDYMLGDKKTVTDLNISRNTHYTFHAEITSFDISGEYEVELHSEVRVWKPETSRPDIPPACYLTISQSEFIIPASALPYDGVVAIDTDHPEGWSAKAQSPNIVLQGEPLVHQYPGRLNFKVTAQEESIIEVSSGNITKYIKVKVV